MSRNSSMANVVWLVAPFVLALPIGYMVFLLKYQPRDLLIMSAIACGLGFSMLLVAKFPSIRKGEFFTLGTKLMSPIARFFYRFGYFLIGLGVFLLIALFVFY